MSDNFASSNNLDPEAGFDPSPSVSQAARDLRDAAEGKAREFASQTTEQTKAIKDKALDSAQQFREAAMEKAQTLRETATERTQRLRESATERAGQFKTVADDQWRDTRDKAKEWQITSEDYIRQHPTKCVLGALGIGFLVGLITRR